MGPPAFIYVYMKWSSKKAWPTKVEKSYQPKISIIVPVYNESGIIKLKLSNLIRLEYPKNLMEIILVDSNSSDDTVPIVRQFIEKNPLLNIKVLIEEERKGKSHALNYALDHCSGDVIVVSDADCFWPFDILEKTLPYLADQSVGVIGGSKFLLNSGQTWVTRIEEAYLRSANLFRLGESKSGSTPFFEGGFSAYKKVAFNSFDNYGTGSDDCGTVISCIEKNFRAMLVPEGNFYCTFSSSFKEKLSIKLRRINQLLRVFQKYLDLLINRKIKLTKITLVPNILLYLLSPLAFTVFLVLTGILAFNFPFILLSLLILLVPKLRFFAYEIVENNLLLIVGSIGVISGRRFCIWSQPKDRPLLTEDLLRKFNLL